MRIPIAFKTQFLENGGHETQKVARPKGKDLKSKEADSNVRILKLL